MTCHFAVQAYLVLLPLADTVFYMLKVCGNPALRKSVGIAFPTAFADFLSVSHFDNCLSNAHFFVIVILFMVICDHYHCNYLALCF